MSVFVNLETAAALHLDILLRINGHQRHLAEHIEHGARFRVVVVLHIICNAVDFAFHHWRAGGHGHAREHIGRGGKHDGAEVGGGVLGIDAKLLFGAHLAHGGYFHLVGASRGQ